MLADGRAKRKAKLVTNIDKWNTSMKSNPENRSNGNFNKSMLTSVQRDFLMRLWAENAICQAKATWIERTQGRVCSALEELGMVKFNLDDPFGHYLTAIGQEYVRRFGSSNEKAVK